MKILWLHPSEWQKLEALKINSPWNLPKPEFAQIVVAVEDDEIVGACIVQEQLHVEPLWVREDKRGSTLAFRLFKEAMETKRSNPVYVSTDQEKVKDYLERLGFDSIGEAFVRE